MSGSPTLLLAELALKSAAVIGIAAGAAWLVRRRSAEERHLAWAAALLALLVLPVLPVPSVEVPVFEFVAAPEGDRGLSRTTSRPAGASLSPAGVLAAETGTASAPGTAEAPGPGPDWPSIMAGAYAVGALALLCWFVLSSLRIAHSLRRLEDVRDRRALALLEDAARRNGLRRRLQLKWSSTDVSPFAWGFLRPVIVLPRRFADAPEDEQRNAIEHEIAHVARWDYLTTSLGYACCAVYWFQPLAWLAWRRMVQESEIACDDRVLSHGRCRRTYARQLLEVARMIRGAPQRNAAAAGMARTSAVSRRITAILDPDTRRQTMNRTQTLSVLAVATALLLPIGSLTAKTSAQASGTDPALIPDSEQALEHRTRALVDAGRAGEASALLAAYLARLGESDCSFCSEALATDRPGSEPAGLLRVVLDAFDRVEQRAREARDGDLLVRLAELCGPGASRNSSQRGVYYLLEGFRIGNLEDDSKLAAVRFLSELGWYAEAKQLAQELHEDRGSGLYHSAETELWIKRLDRHIAQTRFVANRLITPQAAVEIEGDMLALYRRAPDYPVTALRTGKEGDVVLEFTLSETGRPEDISIVSSTDSAFEAPAREAVSGFLYAPYLVNGVPVEKPGVRLTMSFRLE